MIPRHGKMRVSGIDGPGLGKPVSGEASQAKAPLVGVSRTRRFADLLAANTFPLVRGALSKGVFCVYPVRPMHESQRRPASSPISQSAVRYKCRQPWPIGPATRQKLPASASVNPYASRSRCDPEGQVWMDDCGTGIRRWWTQSWESQWDPSNPMSRFAVRLAPSLG